MEDTNSREEEEEEEEEESQPLICLFVADKIRDVFGGMGVGFHWHVAPTGLCNSEFFSTSSTAFKRTSYKTYL